MAYLTMTDPLDAQSLQQAAVERVQSPAKASNAGKAQGIGTVGGTILGAILGGMAGNPMMGASLGGSLGGTVGGMIGNKDVNQAPGALAKADALWGMYNKRPKLLTSTEANPGVATGDFGMPASDLSTSMMA